MNNVTRIGKTKEESLVEKYIKGVVSDAAILAKQSGHTEVQPEHLMSVVLRHMANAYSLNKAMSETIRDMKIDIEALRKAM